VRMRFGRAREREGALRVRVRLGRVCGRKGRALQAGVGLGRVYKRKGRALQAGVILGRELQARVRVIRGLQRKVRLGRARKRSERARKSNTAPLAIEKSLLRTSASSLYIIYAGNGIRKQTGSGKQSKRELFPLTRRL
jgi:hypothetical protein